MTITVDDVRAVYGPNAALTDDQIQDIIDLVDVISGELLADCGYSTTMLNAIERYLAAHYIAIGYENGGVIRKRTGDSEERYRELSLDTSGLAMTTYGQQALALDINGCLNTMATKSVQAQFRVV